MAANLPELLARDLEMSESVFVSKHMTAGAPCPIAAVQDLDQLYLPGGEALLQDPEAHDLVHSTPEGHLSLGSADDDDDYPVVRKSGVDNSWKRRGLALSSHPLRWEYEMKRVSFEDSESDLSSEQSFDAGPVPTRIRHQSIATAATSVGSDRCSLQAPKQAMPVVRNGECSWMDLEPDPWDVDECVPGIPEFLRDEIPRPHTSTGHPAADWKDLRQFYAPNVPRRRSSLGHRPTTVAASEPPPSRRTSLLLDKGIQNIASNDFAYEPEPLPAVQASGHQRQHSRSERPQSPGLGSNIGRAISPELRLSQRPERRSWQTAKSSLDLERIPRLEAREDPICSRLEPSRSYHHALADETNVAEEQVRPQSSARLAVASPLVTRTSPPASPTIRISAEMIETLRVSTACFPETMLLSSSLVIETIRSNSRRLRRSEPPEGPSVDMFAPEPRPPTQKRSRLRRMLSSRKVASSAASTASWSCSSLSPASSAPPSPSATSPVNLAPIKAVFPLGSDYLCDALYAHIVAFNYISSLCRPHPAAPSASRHPGTSTSHDLPGQHDRAAARPPSRGPDDDCRVPKKAASLLGLSHITSLGHRRGVPSSASSKRDPGGADPGATSATAVADLLDALSRCVAQLVATLKLMAGEQDAPIRCAAGAEELDPLLLKTICELVRCCEERY